MATSAVVAGSQPALRKEVRPAIVLHIGRIGVGMLSTDGDVVKVYGEGVYVDDEGHIGGRYFTNSRHSVTLHTEIGVDRCTESIELLEGLHIPGVTAESVPAAAVSRALDKVPDADHAISLGMSPEQVLAILGPPKTDEQTSKARTLYYETSYDIDDRVTLFYQARYDFVKKRLVSISLYDGE